MVRLTLVVGAREPEVPVTVIELVPVAAEPLMVRLNVLLEVVVAGLKLALTPAGGFAADNATLPENPFAGRTDTVTEPLAPCCNTTVPGEDVSVKLGG